MTLRPPRSNCPNRPDTVRIRDFVLAAAHALLLCALTALPALAASRLIPPVERHLDELRQAGLPGDDPVYTDLPTLPIAGGEDASWLTAFGPPTISNSVLAAVVLPDSTLIVGGDFLSANDEPVFHVARWADFEWEAMGAGLDGPVYALEAWNGQVIAGGLFQAAADDTVAFHNVARWDGSSWQPMGDGFDASVLDLHELEGSLYASGWFGKSGNTELNHVARWDEGSSSWQPLAGGLVGGPSPQVSALGDWSGQLLAGGRFEQAAGATARNLASWDGAAWTEFGGGTSERVYAMQAFEQTLYVGGLFTQAGGIQARYVAKWNDAGWAPVDGGTNAPVLTFAAGDTSLYVGGLFTIAGAGTAISVARYSPASDTLTSVSSGMNGGVTQLLPWEGSLFAGGIFTQAGGADVSYVSTFREDGWGPIGAALDGPVHALEPWGDRLIVGGEFTRAGRYAAGVAAWDGRRWSTLGAGLVGTVEALGVYQGDLYAGGSFVLPDSTNSFFARWDEDANTWYGVGPVGNRVHAISTYGSSLLIGGEFNSAGGISVGKIALFDGESFSPLGNGLNNTVRALGTYDGEPVAGGDFVSSLLTELNHIAHFDGTEWKPFGFGTDGTVRDIVRFPGDGTRGELLIGGDFTQADSLDLPFLALWNDSTWTGMGTQVVGPSVESFLSTGASLYVGGECNVPTLDGGGGRRIARANGAYEWSALGTGLNGRALAFAVFQDLLYVGGTFSSAGGKSSPYLARWEDLGPVPVQLAHLDGRRENGEVVLRWFVSESFDHAGFYVYRDETSPSARITPDLLFAEDGNYELHDPAASGAETSYWIEEISTSGRSNWFGPIVVGPGRVGVDKDSITLNALGPLPFRGTTSFRLRAPIGTEVRADVFDVRGRRVRSLWQGTVTTATLDLEWHGENDAGEPVSSALYFLRVNGPDWRRTLQILRIE